MKKITLFLSLTVFLTGLSGQSVFDLQEKNAVRRNGIKQKIQMNYKYINGEPSSEGYVSSISKFDAYGNTTEIINYRSNGQIISVINYQYDGHGNRIDYVRFKGNREKITYKQAYKYDAQGRKIEESGFDGATYYKNSYEYDARGKLKAIKYQMGAALIEKREFTYVGNDATVKVYDASDKQKFYLKRKYTSGNRLLEEVKYLNDNRIAHKLNYNYDSHGNIIEESKYVNGNLSYRTISQYDNSKLKQIMQENPNRITYVTNKYIYDANGNLVTELWKKNNAQEFSKKTYTYDGKGKCTSIDCYFASYKFKVLYELSYEM